MEAVVAERICYMIEEGLLPASHFGARKKRSAQEALLILQEHIYNAWRSKKILSLISFDVKGAYNGVCKDRLIQRLEARGIPRSLPGWIDVFCSERTASIQVNGYTSTKQELLQAGLPQGSPLSPALFFFFNADLMQYKINSKGGSLAFVDDYGAWVTGPSAEANRVGTEVIIDRAMKWERRSRATFESSKTAITHFTRTQSRNSSRPYIIKGELGEPKESAKILGVVMDSQLRYKQHIAAMASKGLDAALALERLHFTTPATARRLFAATIAPVIDYASTVWGHGCGYKEKALINRVQRVGAQAIIGAFRTVSTTVAEAEASIQSVNQRHGKKGNQTVDHIATLPKTNPITRINTRSLRRFISLLQKFASRHQDQPTDKVETIELFIIPP